MKRQSTMRKLSIVLTALGLSAFCVGQVAAQTGGPGAAAGSSAGAAGGIGAAGTGAMSGIGAAGSSQAGSSVPAPMGSSNISGAGSSTFGGVPGASPTVPPSTQLPNTSMPSGNATQNPLTAQGSGGNVEAGRGSYGAGGGSSSDQTQAQNVQRVNPNDPRLVRFNNEWWYWMPGNYWSYYRNNNWNRYDPYAFQPLTTDTIRYQTGYRGTAGPVYYLDENGMRYRRFYAPEIPQSPALEAARPQSNTQDTIGGAVRGETGPRVGTEIGGAVRNQ